MIIIEPIGGLANRMRVIASALHLQKQINSRLLCIWNENSDLNAPFNTLFENVDGLMIQSKLSKYNYLKSTNQKNVLKKLLAKLINKLVGVDYCIKENDFNKLILTKKIDLMDIVTKNKTIYIQTCQEFGDNYTEYQKFRPIADLEVKIASLVKIFNYSIGLHIRRTDNSQSIEFSPVELFIDKINLEICRNKNATFFLSTDDENVEKELVYRFEERIITNKKEFSRNSIKGMQDAVIDMYCLSKTSFIYGSYWTSFSDIASRIGKIEFIELRN